jgi:hypothetical protein
MDKIFEKEAQTVNNDFEHIKQLIIDSNQTQIKVIENLIRLSSEKLNNVGKIVTQSNDKLIM